MVVAVIRESRQEMERGHRDNRAAHHPSAGANFCPAYEKNRSTFHLQSREIAHRPFDGDDPSFHAHAAFNSTRAFDNDRASLPTCMASSIARPNLSASFA